MGVKGLHSCIEGKLPQREHTMTLSALAIQGGPSATVVVDGMALIRRLYTQDLDWVSGGQYLELWNNVRDFVGAFRRQGLRLVLFFDGGVDEAKLIEWASRRRDDQKKCQRVSRCLENGEPAPKQAWMPPPNISKHVGGAFRDVGCQVYFTAGEADREMAQYCIAQRCVAVLGKDSDFFVLPVRPAGSSPGGAMVATHTLSSRPRPSEPTLRSRYWQVPCYLVLDSLQLRADPPTVTAYTRPSVEAALELPSPLWPLLGSLVGNDFVQA